MNTTQSVAEKLICAMFNQEPAVEPPGLPKLTPGVHQYLGNLPHELCHVFVELDKMNKGRSFDPETDADVTEACRLFSQDVAFHFNLPKGTFFEIVAGLKAALRSSEKQTVVEHDDTCSY